MNLYAAIEITMKALKSMKIGDLEPVGNGTCLHPLSEEASQFSELHFSLPFMSFKCFMVSFPDSKESNWGI
jgi:hypothetical protein